jgi:hypothetical protein
MVLWPGQYNCGRLQAVNQGIGHALVGAVKGTKRLLLCRTRSAVSEKSSSSITARSNLVHDAGVSGNVSCSFRLPCDEGENPADIRSAAVFHPNNNMVQMHHTALEILEQVACPINVSARSRNGRHSLGIGETLKALKPEYLSGGGASHAAILAGGSIGTHFRWVLAMG